MPHRMLTLVTSAVLVAACGSSEAARGPVVQVDTLPGGAIQVTNTVPTGSAAIAVPWRFEEAATYGGADGATGELIEPARSPSTR